MNYRLRWYDLIFAALLFYLLVMQIAAIWPFTIDDMYISLRYAKNWVAGEGLLWNTNDPPVEGYSNFSFVVLAALALLLHFDPVITLKVAGIIGLLFTCYFVYLITRFWFAPRESLLACFAPLFYKGQIIWSVSGLETTVFQALITAAVYYMFRGLGYQLFNKPDGHTNKYFFLLAGFFLTAAGLTRPETPAFMVLFFILIIWQQLSLKKTIKELWPDLVYFILPMMLVFIPYFLWRWHYYGYLFPNPVYCKGFIYATHVVDLNYLKFIWPFAILAIIAMFNIKDKRPYFLLFPSILYLVLLSGADPVVAFDNRLFLPVFVLLLPLTLKGLSGVINWFIKDNDKFFHPALYFAFALFVWLFIPSMSIRGYAFFSENPIKGEQLRMQVVHWLSDHAKIGDTVVAGDAGFIPYHSPLHFIDSYCLNNSRMAHYRVADIYGQFCREVLAGAPKFIILTSLIESGAVIYTPSDQCIINLLHFQSKYKMVKKFSTNNSNSRYRYELFSF